MTPREIRRRTRTETLRACVVADGCRDYAVEVITPTGAGLLRDWRGRIRYFKNLGDAHRLLLQCNIDDVVLRQRVAHDEACHGAALSGSGFTEMRLHRAA